MQGPGCWCGTVIGADTFLHTHHMSCATDAVAVGLVYYSLLLHLISCPFSFIYFQKSSFNIKMMLGAGNRRSRRRPGCFPGSPLANLSQK